jgi:hypothetical protein
LSKVVTQIPAARQGRLVSLFVIHIPIEIYEGGLTSADEFDGDVQRDGYDVLKRDQRVEEGGEAIE